MKSIPLVPGSGASALSRSKRALIAAATLALSLVPCHSQLTSHPTRESFEAAVTDPLYLEDFESIDKDTELGLISVFLPMIGMTLSASSTGESSARQLIDVPPLGDRSSGGGIDSPDMRGSHVRTWINVDELSEFRLEAPETPTAPKAVGFDFSGASGGRTNGVSIHTACQIRTADGEELIYSMLADDGFVGFVTAGSPIVLVRFFDESVPDGAQLRTGERMAIDNVVVARADTDSDGMPDDYELSHGHDPEVDDAGEDPDDDALDNLAEFRHRSDPHDPDSDGDGLLDGVESATGLYVDSGDFGTNPRQADTDFDGVIDSRERLGNGMGTDPNNSDTDGDGELDGFEIAQGSDPNDPDSKAGGFAAGLVSYWPFDGNSEDLINDNHASPWEAQIPYVVGKFGQAESILINPVRCVVDGGDDSEMDFAVGSMTVSVWFKMSVAQNRETALAAKGPGDAWRLYRRGNGNLVFSAGFAEAEATGLTLEDGQWHHAVGIAKEGAATELYLDGALVATAGAPSIGDGQMHLHIGAQPTSNGWINRWHGEIDDVAVWGRPLLGEEVSAIWNGGAGASIAELLPPTPFLVTDFAFDAENGVCSIAWRSGIGEIYSIERSADLVMWEEVDDSIESAGEFTTFDDSYPPGSVPLRVYYRVRKR